jgi:hypothetical protein
MISSFQVVATRNERLISDSTRLSIAAIILAEACTGLDARDTFASVTMLSLIAIGSVLALVFTRPDSIWVILGSAIVCLVADSLRVILSV